MLSRIYGSEGGPEALDVLMKYLYAVSSPMSRPFCSFLPLISNCIPKVQGNVAYLSTWLWAVIYNTPSDWRVLTNTVKRRRRRRWTSDERAAQLARKVSGDRGTRVNCTGYDGSENCMRTIKTFKASGPLCGDSQPA